MPLLDFPMEKIVAAFRTRRRLLALWSAAGLLIALTIALCLRTRYMSSALLMPPDSSSLAPSSSLAGLSASVGTGLGLSGGGGAILGLRTPGQTVIGILSSRAVLDPLVDQFKLNEVYGTRLRMDARQKLLDYSIFDEDKKSGLITISVIDREPSRSQALAKAYTETLNRVLVESNSSSAQRERVFLKDRLKSIKATLDASAARLSQFASRNATLNPENQGRALIEETARLQADLISAQSELSALRAQYSDGNVRVRNARARVGELQAQIGKLSGGGNSDQTQKSAGTAYPNLRQLPALGASYAEISRELTVQEGLYASLAKQYELAQVQEAKDLPSVKVLVEPELPERKYSPHRGLIALAGLLVGFMVGAAYITITTLWQTTDDSDPVKSKLKKIATAIRAD